MNTENEKRWFVYIGDHHEGPLTAREVFDKKQQGQVNPESYVWKEGMADWLMLSQVSELTQALQAFTPAKDPEPAPSSPQEPLVDSSSFHHDEHTPTPIHAKLELKNPTRLSEPNTETPALDAMEPKETREPKNIQLEIEEPKKKLGKILSSVIVAVGVIVLLILGSLAAVTRTSDPELHSRVRPLVEKITQSAPFLKSIFRTVPALSDVKPDELSELESARNSSLEAGGKIGVALSLNDPNRPAFYLTTNLPNLTRFEIVLTGDSETLLNRLQFNAQASVKTTYGFGKSEVFLMEGGQPIPKGEYQIQVFESPTQEESVKAALAGLPTNRGQVKTTAEVPQTAMFVTSKKYFLGGEKDETYLTRLKTFHENIKQKADRELSELRQYTETMVLQQTTLTTEFQKLFKAKKITPAMKAAWTKDSSTWTQISGQLDQTIQTWSKETLQNEFFYGKVYEWVKSAFQSMQTLISLEIAYIEKPQDKNAFEIQHGKLLSESRDALELLKTKMEILNKAPKTPSGLPTREGL